MTSQVPVLTWAADAHGQFSHLDPAWLAFTGRLEAPPDLNWTEHLHPDDASACLPLYNDAIQHQRSFALELRLKQFDGVYRWFLMTGVPQFAQHGSLSGYVGAFVDITHRKSIEEELRHSQARLEGIIASAMDAVISVDEQQRIIVFNAAAEALFGYSAEEIKGQPLDRLIPQPYRARHHQHMRTFATTGVTTRSMYSPGQLMALRAGGDQFPIEAAISQVDVGGQKIFTVILRDISERKRAEANLHLLYEAERQARQEAEKADKLKLQFLAMISHELRTPLASIKGFVTTLLADDVTFDAHQQRQFLNVIDAEADRLHRLIEQLLDSSRLQAGTLSIAPVPVELSAILADAAPQLEILTAKHKLQLDVPKRIPFLRADRRRVVQVVVNLVDNAVTFSPPDTEICVSAHPHGDFVQVRIADQGPGIPYEERQHVFEAFQQLGHGSGKGAGLGLAICKGLVEAHGGAIWIDDTPGGGTTVAFTLPVFVGVLPTQMDTNQSFS